MQLQHSCDLLLASDLFTFHSERMCDLLLKESQTVRAVVIALHAPPLTESRSRAPIRIAS